MRAIPWRIASLLVIAGSLLAVAITPDPNARSLSTWTTEELIDGLENERAIVRSAVVGQLVARAKTVVPTVVAATDQASEAKLDGLFDVLEQLMLSNDGEISESGESALERLAVSPRGEVADRAMQVLFGNATLRHARALSKYLQLGGRFAAGETWEAAILPTDLATSGTYRLSPHLLLIDHGWMGGDDGLIQVARLFPGEPVLLYVGDDAPVTNAGLKRLRSLRAYVEIRREQEACLGITVDRVMDGESLRILSVAPRSPAALAGLVAGDAMLKFGGIPTRTVSDLKNQAATLRPGDRVEIVLQRGTRTLRIKLAVGSDFATGNCQCVAQASSAGHQEN